MNWEAFTDREAVLPGDPIPGRFGYRRMSHEAYLAFPALSASLLKCRTAAEMHATLTQETPKDSAALDIGTLTHMALLEPEANWRARFALADIPINQKTQEAYGKDTKKALAAVAEAAEANPGKIVVSADLLTDYLAICRSLAFAYRANPDAVHELADVETEVTGILWHPRWNCWVKWRPDVLPRHCRHLVDVKTSSRHVADFGKDAWQFGYYLQAAWYAECHELACARINVRVGKFTFIVLSKADESRYPRPPMCRVYDVPMDASLSRGISQAKMALGLPEGFSRVDMFLDCLRNHIAAGCPTEEFAVRRIWPAYELEAGERGRWVLAD